ncbi:phospholipase [Planctomycetaceae bacterium SCGC AG-212-F19]|nr:phospholipase [Planctomycetaceae bacterium SCGC AG-212-F19]
MKHINPLVAALSLGLGLPGSAGAEADPLPLEKRTFTAAGGKVLPYRLLKPADYDPKQRYPLVLLLHGAGERGDDNEKQLVHGVPQFLRPEMRKQYPCFVVAPQCPAAFKWVDADWSAAAHKLPAEPTEPMRLTIALLEALPKDWAIDTKRVYVTGLSMGGFGAWDIAARRPELFAAVVPVCGGADEATAPTLAKIPHWAFHGAKDGVVKPARSRNMIDALKKAGGAPRYTEYPNVGHDSWNPAYGDPKLYEWLFAQKRP